MDFTQVAGGFCLIEAPRWDGTRLWFTDILLGGFRRLDSDGEIAVRLTERMIIGGLAFNDDGKVLCSGTGGIVWTDPQTGEGGTLLDTIDGEPISGVNDIFPDGRGGLYFGTVDHIAMLSGGDFYGKSGLYRLDPDGTVTCLHYGIGFSNGIGVSPDGRTVYIVDSAAGLYAVALDGDGGAQEEGRLLCKLPGIDGMTVDAEGNLWCALIISGEIAMVRPDGTIALRQPVPGGHPVSLCFGGPELRDLYVTTAAPGAGEAALDHSRIASVPRSAGVYRTPGETPGLPLAKTSFRLGAA